MEQEASEQQQVYPKLSDAAVKANLSLKEMLELRKLHRKLVLHTFTC